MYDDHMDGEGREGQADRHGYLKAEDGREGRGEGGAEQEQEGGAGGGGAAQKWVGGYLDRVAPLPLIAACASSLPDVRVTDAAQSSNVASRAWLSMTAALRLIRVTGGDHDGMMALNKTEHASAPPDQYH